MKINSQLDILCLNFYALKVLLWYNWKKKSKCLSKPYAQNKLSITNAMVINSFGQSHGLPK
jgi:hypothetical protein